MKEVMKEARIKNPAAVLPGAMEAIQSLISVSNAGGVPSTTLNLVHLRASQINGCHICVDFGTCHAQQAGESDHRLFSVASWQKASCFTEAERAALALSEAVTRLSDREDPVPDEIWNEAARYYDERALASLILWIATTNVFNRLNVATGQVAPTW
jgi:AhpD family alkylhydroperoxidase